MASLEIEPPVVRHRVQGRTYLRYVIGNEGARERRDAGKDDAGPSASAPVEDDDDVADGDVRWVDKRNVHEMRLTVARSMKGAVLGKRKTFQGTRVRVDDVTGDECRVVITSAVEASVRATGDAVREICAQVSERLPPTHFLAIPLDAASLQETVADWQCQVAGLVEHAFDARPYLGQRERLHVTLLMLKLHTRADVERAAALLRDQSAAIYDLGGTRSLHLAVTGVACMQDDPAKARTVYASIAPNDGLRKLQAVQAHLASQFAAAGLAAGAADEPFKAHATLMNAAYAKGAAKGQTFDARRIIDAFGDGFAFDPAAGAYGTKVETVSLLQRGAYEASGAYKRLAQVKLP